MLGLQSYLDARAHCLNEQISLEKKTDDNDQILRIYGDLASCQHIVDYQALRWYLVAVDDTLSQMHDRWCIPPKIALAYILRPSQKHDDDRPASQAEFVEAVKDLVKAQCEAFNMVMVATLGVRRLLHPSDPQPLDKLDTIFVLRKTNRPISKEEIKRHIKELNDAAELSVILVANANSAGLEVDGDLWKGPFLCLHVSSHEIDRRKTHTRI